MKYILRPAVAQEQITLQPDCLVRIALKKAFSDADEIVTSRSVTGSFAWSFGLSCRP